MFKLWSCSFTFHRQRTAPLHCSKIITLLLASSLLVSCAHRSKPLFQAVSAHRGRTAIGLMRGIPDNSKEAILIASRYAEFIELDLRRTKDGRLVLLHEKRRELGQRVLDMTVEELLKEQPRPILLEEAVSLLSSHSSIYTLDLKGYSRQLLQDLLPLLQRYRTRLVLQCSSLACLREARRSDLRLPVLTRLHSPDDFEDALIHRSNLVQVDEEWSGEYYVRLAHLFNIPVLIKTLSPDEDTKAQWQYLRRKGVDVILTDYPDEIRATVDRE